MCVFSQISGCCWRIQFDSHSVMAYSTVSQRPARSSIALIMREGLFSFCARRWSSQTIAGRSGLPALSTFTIVSRCVVMHAPRIASRGMDFARMSFLQVRHSIFQ